MSSSFPFTNSKLYLKTPVGLSKPAENLLQSYIKIIWLVATVTFPVLQSENCDELKVPSVWILSKYPFST